MLFKRLILTLFMFLSTSMALAGPEQQERHEACVVEATLTNFGFRARAEGMPKDVFVAEIQRLRDEAAKSPELSKEQIENAVKAITQGYHGIHPQKAYDACMSKKQV